MDDLVALLRLTGEAALPLTLASRAVWALAPVQHIAAEPFRTIAAWLCLAALGTGVAAACWHVLRAAFAAQSAEGRHDPPRRPADKPAFIP